MVMADPIVAAARRTVADGFDTLRRVIAGLPADALNWRPAGEDTNPLAVLATHAGHATRFMLHLALDLPLPPRDRPAEFVATAESAESLIGLLDGIAADCDRALASPPPVDWSSRRRRTRDDGEVVDESAAYVLLHAVEHLRGHADEASLTRHAWMARSAP
jgi:hypothetical protein